MITIKDAEDMGRFAAAIHNEVFRKGYDHEIVSQPGHISSIVTNKDTGISDYFLNTGLPGFPAYRSRAGWEASFSEEDDPKLPAGYPLRCAINYNGTFAQIDPIDGTGDLVKNVRETGKPTGASILGSIIQGCTPVAGMIYLFPEQKMLLGTPDTGPRLYYVDGDKLVEEHFTRKRKLPTGRVRINRRPAYPLPHLDDFFNYLQEQDRRQVEIVDLGGAGDALAHLILGDIDFVFTGHGNWKTWDTDPAIAMGARITQDDGETYSLRYCDLYGGKLVATTRHPIPWHNQGNIFSIDGDAVYMGCHVKAFEHKFGVALRADNIKL